MGKFKVVLIILLIFRIVGYVQAGAVSEDFEKGSLPSNWKIEGKVNVSSDKAHTGSKSLVVGENSSVTFDFSKNDTFGKVSFWVYDNKFKCDWKKDGFINGPYWGIKNTKGEVLMVGVTFRDHTTGDKLYNWMTTTEIGGENYIWWMDLKRSEGWHRWEINYPDDKSSIKIIKDEGESPSDWTFSRFKTHWIGGFNGIVIKGNKQFSSEIKEPFYFDDINIDFK